jgi:hypothetical protein
MIYFIQAKEYAMIMYATTQCMNLHVFCNYFLQDLDSWNFTQSKNAQIKIESSILLRSTQVGSNKIILYFSKFYSIF